MGFRSKMMTGDYGGINVPDWFISKWPTFHYSWNGYQPVMSFASRTDRKFYSLLKETEIFTDIQKVLVEQEYTGTFPVVLLHECGGITLVHITQTSITGREPTAWKEVESVEHNYCYGCSEPEKPAAEALPPITH